MDNEADRSRRDNDGDRSRRDNDGDRSRRDNDGDRGRRSGMDTNNRGDRSRRSGSGAVAKQRGGSGRGRGMGGRQINRDGRRRGGRGGGSHFYSLNDRVMGLWASENKYYRATVSSVHWDGTYGIVFDMENDKEYLGQREEQLQPIKNYKYEENQKVKALFVKDDRWYDAKIVAIEQERSYVVKNDVSDRLDERLDIDDSSRENEERSEPSERRERPKRRDGYKIRFNHLDKVFTQRAEYLRPCLALGTRVMALWFKDGKYLPATIVVGEEEENGKSGNYTVQFDSRRTEFPGQRPDNIIPLEEFEKDEEVLALWGQDGLFYPAQITDVIQPDNSEMASYTIKFHGLSKEFSARAYNLKKMS